MEILGKYVCPMSKLSYEVIDKYIDKLTGLENVVLKREDGEIITVLVSIADDMLIRMQGSFKDRIKAMFKK